MRLGGALDQLVVQDERRRHRVRIGLPQRGRALDVRHHERHDAGRERDPVGGRRRRLVLGLLCRSRRRHGQLRVVRQHGRLELPQPLARLDPELLDQRPARVLVGLQRVRLPVRPVQREHQLRAQALPVRMLVHQPLQLGDHLSVPAQRELGVDRLLGSGHAQVLEPGYLRLRERLVCQVRERRAPPQRERALERLERRSGPLGRELSPALLEQPLEPVRVELVGVDLQLVAVTAGHEHPVRQLLAQPGHVRLQRLHGIRRSALAPQLVDQPLARQRLATVEKQRGEHCAAPVPA